MMSRASVRALLLAFAGVALLTVVPLGVQAQVPGVTVQPGATWFQGSTPPMVLSRPLFTAPGVDAYMAGRNQFVFPQGPFQTPPPLWAAPGLSDYLAGRNDFVFPQGQFQSQPPLWTPPGLNDFLAGQNRFVFPQAGFQQPPLFLPNGLARYRAAQAARGR